MNYYVLYNPMAGKGQCEEVARSLESKLDGAVEGYADMTKITNYSAFLSDKKDNAIVVCGGDGTVNEVVNGIISAGAGESAMFSIDFTAYQNGVGLKDATILDDAVYDSLQEEGAHQQVSRRTGCIPAET